jgi:hypothetical protein
MLKRCIGNVWLMSKFMNSSLDSLVIGIPTKNRHGRW